MIPQRNISLLSNRLAADGSRRIPEAVLERDYCLAWFLATLSGSPLKAILAFKGGTALKRCYFDDYRFSEDLDFTLLQPAPVQNILQHLETLYAEIHQTSGIRFGFDRMDRHGHLNTHTFYLSYSGPLPTPNSVKVDITVEEAMTHPRGDRPVLRSYPEFTDVPEHHQITVYSLEEIAVEKTVALADVARTEPRDLYDLWYLTTEGAVDLLLLHDGIRQKLAFRGKPFAGIRFLRRFSFARTYHSTHDRARNAHRPLSKVDVAPLQSEKLALPQPCGGYDEHQRPLSQPQIID